MQYQGADVFMICVVCTEKINLEGVGKWKAEVQEVEAEKPILLISTKSDLVELAEDPITFADLKSRMQREGF